MKKVNVLYYSEIIKIIFIYLKDFEDLIPVLVHLQGKQKP